MIISGVAWFTQCDKCGERWGPYESTDDAVHEPTLDGWLVTDTEVLCYACQDIDEDDE